MEIRRIANPLDMVRQRPRYAAVGRLVLGHLVFGPAVIPAEFVDSGNRTNREIRGVFRFREREVNLNVSESSRLAGDFPQQQLSWLPHAKRRRVPAANGVAEDIQVRGTERRVG